MNLEPSAVASFDAGFERLMVTSVESRFGFAFGHVRLGPMEVYIRIGKRMVSNEYEQAVSLVNLQVPVEFQRQGLFTIAIERIRLYTALPLFLEDTHADFAKHLMTKGWCLQRANMNTIDLYRRE